MKRKMKCTLKLIVFQCWLFFTHWRKNHENDKRPYETSITTTSSEKVAQKIKRSNQTKATGLSQRARTESRRFCQSSKFKSGIRSD